MRLDRLIDEVDLRGRDLLLAATGELSTDVSTVSMDSREVLPGALFACVPGATSDGHDYAATAIADGATALLCERSLPFDSPQIVVRSVRQALGPVCDLIYGRPSQELLIAAVTGTNGKTTTCSFLHSIFEVNGWPAMTLGTLTQRRTTPEAPDLHALLADWRRAGGEAVAMEVSSHALQQHRTDAVRFSAGVFTNLTPEHLDYHTTMESYFEAKARLFEPGRVGVAVINIDDLWGARLADRIRVAGDPLVTFSPADAHGVELRPSGSTFTWRDRRISIRIGGLFNVANAVAAAASAEALGIDRAAIADGLAGVESVAGRFELVDVGQPFTVIVDYAHTPDGLTKILEAARQICNGRLVVVFGAGGDRDRDKRPMMGAAASARADLALVTSDNPRHENPESIIAEVMSGAPDATNIQAEADRAAAIATALANASPGDVVVIAGKGHEKGQEIAGRTLPFDDVDVATKALRRIMQSRQGGSA